MTTDEEKRDALLRAEGYAECMADVLAPPGRHAALPRRVFHAFQRRGISPRTMPVGALS